MSLRTASDKVKTFTETVFSVSPVAKRTRSHTKARLLPMSTELVASPPVHHPNAEVGYPLVANPPNQKIAHAAAKQSAVRTPIRAIPFNI